MEIKNYLVENYQLIISYLEQELCKNNISYVRIDNEIHFLDQIIRFYDFELDRNDIINWIFWNLVKFKKTEIVEISTFDEVSNFKFSKLHEYYINSIDEMKFSQIPKDYQSRNKYIQKQESNLVKQKLKLYGKR